MPRKRFSVAMLVAAALVTVTTLVLGAAGAARYAADRAEKWERLRRVNQVTANVLALSLALPIWNIDRAQIDKILQSMEATQPIEAVVVTAAGRTQARVRRGKWLEPADGKIDTAGLLVEERGIVFDNQRIGTLRLYVSPKSIEAELRQSAIRMVVGIVALDALLVMFVYVILWRTVLRPLVEIERLAAAVTAGGEPAPASERPVFAAELETLRGSIETMIRGLREGELRFRTIFDSANDAIFLTDPESGTVLDVNARGSDMFGYSRQESVGADVAQLGSGIAPYPRGRAGVFEWQARHRDGHLFWVEGSMRLATIAGRRIMIVVIRDIAQRKEMERALKAETDFTEAAIDSIPGVFFVRDRAGKLLRWNKAMERLRAAAGVDVDSPGLPTIHPHDRPRVQKGIDDIFEHGEWEGESRVVGGGETRYFLLNGRRMDRDDEAFLVGTGIDITDRKRLEAAIERSAIEWRQTFDSVQTPIIITDGDGVVRRLNAPAAQLAGIAGATAAGAGIGALGDGPWSAAAELIAAFHAGAGRSGAEARDRLGRVWDVTVMPLVSSESDRGLIVVFWEITGIVALQESLRRSERMSAMGALVGGVAHEVRNPLFGMTALLDAYADEMRGAELAEFAAKLREQVMRLIHLMRELLEFGRPVAITLTPAALHDVVNDAVAGRAHAAARAGVTLRNAVPTALPELAMDYARLCQVFENLIDNALQQAPAVRTVTIAAREIVHGGYPAIECAVEDDGAGFRADDLPAVFEPFFTRREDGTGLGLSIVQRIVEEHAGQVSAGNRASGGAVITMLFPLSGATAARPVNFIHAAQQNSAG
jgi:PAS domain S-box-containing protein